MHPAYSVIFFTVASGAGYGMLALLGLGVAFGQLPAGRWLGFACFAFALGLVSGGLLSSTFHLGHPERAWRAITQWRSSWLSREGLSSLVTFVPVGLFAIGWVFLGRNDGIWAWFGGIGALLAAVTVYCTGMIYASLKPIPRWHNGWVTPVYLVFALGTGAVWLHAILRLFGQSLGWLGWLAVVASLVAWLMKLGYWRMIDTAPARASAETATGLGEIGRVRLLEAPHTEENYLLKEMGYRVARKHAVKLRGIALVGGAIGLVLSLLGVALDGSAGTVAAVIAAVVISAAAIVERWLFFAEARHAVTLYYGAARV